VGNDPVTKSVGFIGGVHAPLLDRFEAGFKAGVGAVDKTIRVPVTYLSQPPDLSGFNDPAKARTVVEGVHDAGSDVVFTAAGGSGVGAFQAAKAKGKLAIGIECGQDDGEQADLRPVIMASMVKRVDIAVYDFAKQLLHGDFKAGEQLFDLKSGGVGYSTSGGRIDDIAGRLDGFREQIVEGRITVPATP
jgi:basic membrane protein A